MTNEELKDLQSKMPTDILMEKVEHQISELARTGGRSHIMCVPPEITDTDMILSEMVRRFENSEAENKKLTESIENSINASDHNRILREQDERYSDRIDQLEAEKKELIKLLEYIKNFADREIIKLINDKLKQ